MAPFNSQLEEFVKNHDSLRRMLYKSFCQKGLGFHAKDLTSEVTYRLLKRICDESFPPIENIVAFARTIARNLIAETYEQRPKQLQSLEDIKPIYLPQENYLDNKLDKEKYLCYIRKCADELNLSLTDRLIIFNDDSHNDDKLAKKIGESVENVRTRRCRLRKQIIECARKHLKLKK